MIVCFGGYIFLIEKLFVFIGEKKLFVMFNIVCVGVLGGLVGIIGNLVEVVFVCMCVDGVKFVG